MAIVLTVDDSRAIRMIVGKVLTELGLTVEEAEDGEQGLAKVEEIDFDLIILDVTMPVLDGPGMLARMREAGKTTPVLMLTSESKRSIVAELMKLKIEDYILKPFKADELKAKILRILGNKAPGVISALSSVASTNAPAAGGAAGAGVTAAAPAADEPGMVSGGGARQFADILVIDDMDNVPRKLRSLLPEHVTMLSALNGQAGVKLAREHTFRLIVVDRDLADVPATSLLQQLRVLQPGAACLAMALRSSNNLANEVREEGFNDVLYKPFNQEGIDDLMQNYFQTQELLTRQNEVITCAIYTGRPDRVDRYYTRIATLAKDQIRGVAEACFESVIFDASKLPPDEKRLPSLITRVSALSKEFGVELLIVGPDAVTRSLREYDETAKIPTFTDLQEAQARAA